MKNFLLLLACFFFAIHSFSQKAPIKYGTVNKAELINNVYLPDTSAAAVVLCDYGYYNDARFQTYRNLRIKVLKKEGLDYANKTIRTDDQTTIRGITYNLENNEIVETKLKSESIYKTRVYDNIYVIKIAMPNVKVGSIVDIEIVYDLLPPSWDFQWDGIPVAHSELVIEPTLYINFKKNFFGYIPLKINERNRWVAENMPAFRAEPYITSSNNYRTRFEFDIESITVPGRFFHAITTSWDAVKNYFYESTYFGSVLAQNGYLNDAAKHIESLYTTPEDKLKMAHEYVKAMKWNNEENTFTNKTSLSTCFKEGKGNSAEVNLALIQLLRKLDFKAVPVLMSTRENGRLSTFNPSLNKLNYVIAAVLTEKDTLLLDATDAYCPYYLLPMRALNGSGQMFDKNWTAWVPISTNKKDKKTIMYTMEIGEDMSMKGKIACSRTDYAALDFRHEYRDFNSDEEYIKDYKDGKQGLIVNSHTVTDLDSLYLPVKEEFEVVIKNALSDLGDEWFFYPLLYEQVKENPFKVTDRSYPIDFGYLREKSIIANFTLPEGYTISSIPESQTLKLPENAAVFSLKTSFEGNKVQVVYKLNINKSVIVQTNYADFREFYNQIVKKHNEPITLKKI